MADEINARLGQEKLHQGERMRFFFDYRTGDESLYDYQGHEFESVQAAMNFAREMAETLKESTESVKGLCVEVRNAHGEKAFSVAVAGG